MKKYIKLINYVTNFIYCNRWISCMFLFINDINIYTNNLYKSKEIINK